MGLACTMEHPTSQRDALTATARRRERANIMMNELVKLKILGPNGSMSVAGTIKRILPDGRVEVKTQQHGYYVVAADEISPSAFPATQEDYYAKTPPIADNDS